MKTRILGKTNSLKVSAVGMGCMGFSHGYGAGHNETIVVETLKPIRNEVVPATKLHIPELIGVLAAALLSIIISMSSCVKDNNRAIDFMSLRRQERAG